MDLALLVAAASSALGTAAAPGTAVIAEVTLAGELRAVRDLEVRGGRAGWRGGALDRGEAGGGDQARVCGQR